MSKWLSTFRGLAAVAGGLFLINCTATRPAVPPTDIKAIRSIAPRKEAPPSKEVWVHFGTNRAPSGADGTATSPPFFGGKDAAQLQYGKILVTIDDNHRRGELDRSVGISAAPVLQGESAYISDLRADLATSGKKLLIFIHGYNVTFRNAARRTAQIKNDLKFSGAAAFYSWPSQGNLTGYWKDEAMVAAAEPFLREFLTTTVSRSGAKKIYIIAHSMGNRAFTSVIPGVRKALPDRTVIKEVILAAPDIDAETFETRIAPVLEDPPCCTTVYSSRKDKALWGSWIVHGFKRRVGQRLLDRAGFEGVDASTVNTTRLGLNHSYYAEQEPLLSDLTALLDGKRPPGRTDTLQPRTGAKYGWLLRR